MSTNWDTAKIREAFIDDGGQADYYDPINGAKEQRRIAGEIFDRWLEARDAEAAEALARVKRGAKTLGEIVERQVKDTLRWAGMEDQIGTDDPDQQLAWERCAEMPGRIAELEAEVVRLSGLLESNHRAYLSVQGIDPDA